MKLKDIILVVILVLGLLLALAYFFKPKTDTSQGIGDGNPGDNPPIPTDGKMPCQEVPDNLPRFQNAVTPANAKTFLNVPDADWTPDFESRLRGFFLAVDVEPTDYSMKYFGAKLIWQYLGSQDGQLPDMVVLKASKRCGTIIGVPSSDMPKPPFCLNFTLPGHWLSPAYIDGKDVGGDGIRSEIGISKSDWGAAMQSRVKGFFKALNLEPTEKNTRALNRYMGRSLVKEYLNSPFGGFPDSMILLGCMRCDGKGNNDQFINNL